MQPFVFHNPTRVIFGEGTVSQTGAEACALGRKALWIYGQQSMKSSGLYDNIRGQLASAGVEFVELPDVRPNPVVSHARQGVALAREHAVDFILATGGGSVIDEAKAIAAATVTGCDPWELFTGAVTATGALPLLVVQTNPATGSEMNGGLVLTLDETQEKYGLFCEPTYPRVAILDPALTLSIPPYVTACSGVDSMAHALEGYFTHRDPWAPIQERYIEGLVKTIMECMDRLRSDPADMAARATFMWGSTLAWNGLQSTGLGAVIIPSHMLEHPLSGLYDIPHGAGLAVMMPAWMAWESRTNPRPIARFARRVMGIGTGDDVADATAGVIALREWIESLGLPTTLTAAGVPAAEIEARIVPHAATLSKAWGVGYDNATLAEIYRSCVD